MASESKQIRHLKKLENSLLFPPHPEGTHRNLPARNMLVQLLALCTDRENHNAQRYRQTDRQTDDMMMPIADLVAMIG